MTDRILSSRYWRDERLDGLECFAARFRSHQYRRHSHEGYVIGVVTDGVEAFYCRGDIHVAGPGDVILINPQSLHDGEAAEAGGWSYRVLYPLEAHFTGLARGGKPPRFRESVVHDPDLAARIASLHGSMLGPACPVAIQQSWAIIASDLVERHGEIGGRLGKQSGDARRIAAVEDLLREGAVAGISLDDIAARIGWSPWHLVRAFKSARGVSPHAFLIECRLRHAKALIDRGENLAMAASDAGFVDQSHFSRHFVRTYGFTPGHYRRALSA